MTPETRALITAFVENRKLADAVYSVLMAEVAPNGIGEFVKGLDRSMPDAEYGQRVKARAEAAALLDAGYAQLAKIAAPSSGVQSQENDAR